MATSKSAWTAFERAAASWIGKILGVVTFRVPLSGMNSRHNAGDVIVPPGYDFLLECKYRSSFMHHSLYRDAVADAAKNQVNTQNVMLLTKVKRERDFLVTVSAEFMARLLTLPGANELLMRR